MHRILLLGCVAALLALPAGEAICNLTTCATASVGFTSRMPTPSSVVHTYHATGSASSMIPLPVAGTLHLSYEGADACEGFAYCEMRVNGVIEYTTTACHAANTFAQAGVSVNGAGLFAIAWDYIHCNGAGSVHVAVLPP